MEPKLHRRIQRYGWDIAASYYEPSWNKQLKPARDTLLEMADLQPGSTVLETACGTGLVTFPVSELIGSGGKITATDISEEMINIATKKAADRNITNVNFIRMDAEDLSLDDQAFDTALCSLGIMYYPNPVQSLTEMHRVLKPGGNAAVSTWGERKKCGWAGIFPIVDKRVDTDVCPMFFQQGTGNTLEYSFEKAGFSNVKTRRISVTLNYTSANLALMGAFEGGPVALAYQKFDEQTKREARQEYLDSISPFRNGDSFRIPGEFVVATGVK
jgi:ubiquinone/menaquinone biosynthesis C-methylase UbiE